uniref:Uncharacterized protein n=1 Tax=Setaria viridis TaxID=4556 RepID=A0A4U6T5T8_SETVI|nr:hypothetical protein SEVIR_9G474400v2 [Setaria viridis]
MTRHFWVWCDCYLPRVKYAHMVGLSAVYWVLWRVRNSVCFDKKQVKSPFEIVCLASSFITYWAGLQKQEAKMNLEKGAEAMKEVALHFHL